MKYTTVATTPAGRLQNAADMHVRPAAILHAVIKDGRCHRIFEKKRVLPEVDLDRGRELQTLAPSTGRQTVQALL